MKILVADDSISFRSEIRLVLAGSGFDVVEAIDGVEAITRFYKESPDLVLLDLNMPRLNGWVVCRVIKEDLTVGRTPVLVLTGMTGAEDRYWADQAGADGVLLKEDIGFELIERIKSLMTTRALADLTGRVSPQADLAEVDGLARVCEMLDRKLFEATIAHEIVGVGVKALDLDSSLRELLASLRRLIGYQVAAIGLLEERLVAVSVAARSGGSAIADFVSATVRALGGLGSVNLAPSDVRAVVLEGADLVEETDGDPWAATRAFPLQTRGRVIGVVALGSRNPDCLDQRALRTLRTIEPTIAAVVDLARRHARAEDLELEGSLLGI